MCIDHRQRGVSLIELVIAIMVIGVAVAGVLSVLTLSTGHSADPMAREQATAIGEAYLEEILLKAFVEPGAGSSNCPGGPLGPEGEGRADYDDVDDYHGLSDDGARDQTGTPVSGLDAYRVDVTVTCSALGDVSATNAKRIEVRVRRGSDLDITVAGYRTYYASL